MNPYSPLINDQLYEDIIGLSMNPKYLSDNNEVNWVPVNKDGSALSMEMNELVYRSPRLLLDVVAYLKDPCVKTEEAMRTGLANCLEIRGWKRDDYEMIDPKVGL